MKRKTLIVVTNARNIRDFEHNFSDGLLPKLITFSEFIKRCFYLENLVLCDNMTQILLMQEAVIRTKKATSVLNFPSEFFEFMKNSEYLFSFFKELAVEKKSINNLKNSDMYADYDEHLTILEELFVAYRDTLEENGFYDEITSCAHYCINESYIKDFDEIIVHIDGFVTAFEFDILFKIRSLCKVVLKFSSSSLNQKIVEQISAFLGLEFEIGYMYEIDFSLGKILSRTVQSKAPKVAVKGFYLRSMQCGYVFEKISTFINEGIDPQKIAIILPDEGFAPILRLHDRENMLNFAMGESFKTTLFYEIFSKIVLALKESERPFFSDNYMEDAPFFEKFGLFFNICGVGSEFFEGFASSFKQETNYEEFYKFYRQIVSLSGEAKVDKLLEKSLFDLKILLNSFTLSLEGVCDIFLNLIAKIQIDHVGGGSVSVIGLLESRSMQYDGVVIVDFNDDLVPNRSINEIFLNSKIREKAGLISHQDRENLQKFYYENIIQKAQKCAICYCLSEDMIPSRFLSHFDCFDDEIYSNDDYLALFKKESATKLRNDEEEFTLKHNFFEKELSFSRLNTFLTCKRKYFYKYIWRIKEFKKFELVEDSALQGQIIHASLSELYQQSATFDLVKLIQIYKQKAKENKLDALEIEFNILNFKRLEELIKKHEDEGWTVYEVEDNNSLKHATFCGVNIQGNIDRIDVRDGQKLIIDYKTGQPDEQSLQLAFYEALLGVECESRFLSLKNMKFTPSKKTILDLENEIENLKVIFLGEVSFERSASSAPCRYCTYRLMCKREM